MNKVSFVMIISLANLFALEAQKKVGFVEEYIDFEIDSTYFSINGIYTFVNYGVEKTQQHIYFPFAEVQENVDSIRVVNLNTMQQVPFRKHGEGISFNLNLYSRDTVDVNIFYRQNVAKKNVYIITTTTFWGSPLNKAVYSLTTPLNVEIVSFSYVPNAKKSEQDKVFYSWEMNNFMPDSDFEFTLKTAN